MSDSQHGDQVASRWLPVIAFALVSAANQMLWLTFAPITTDAARHYHVSEGAIGWLAEIFPLLYVVLALPTGRLIERHLSGGLAAGALLTAGGALLRLVGHGYPLVLVGQIVIAVAQPLILNSVTKLPARYVRPADRPTAIAVSSAGIFAGMVLALLLGATLGGHRIPALLSVEALFALLAAGLLCATLRAPGIQPAPEQSTNLGSESSDGSQPAASEVGGSELAGLRLVWADPYLRLLTGLVSVGFGVFIALTTWLQALLKPAGVSDSAAGTLLLIMVLAGVLGSALLPGLLARHAREQTFLLTSIVVGALGCLVLAVTPGVLAGVPVLLLMGLFMLTDLPVILELAERRAGPAGATATALLWMAGNAAGLVAALIVQVLLHHPAAAFTVLGLLLLLGLPMLRALSRVPGEPSSANEPDVRTPR